MADSLVSAWLPLVGCCLLSGLFVGSLYVWISKYDRNHPATIRQRFYSIFVVMLLSPMVLKLFIVSDDFKKYTIFELVGFRLSGLFSAAVIPLLLTMTLFLGPLCMQDYSTLFQTFFDIEYWKINFKSLIWLRNVIVGPFSEEFTFRACMMPLLLQSYTPSTAVLVCSLIFGLAHLHHAIEGCKSGESFNSLVIRAVVQFLYTSLFGAYSAYLFIQSGHFLAPFLAHSFCNALGFPDFGELIACKNPKRIILMCLFVIGVVLWCILLGPLLNPQLYENYVYMKHESLP